MTRQIGENDFTYNLRSLCNELKISGFFTLKKRLLFGRTCAGSKIVVASVTELA